MYYKAITLYPKQDKIAYDEIKDLLWHFLFTLECNGQILKNYKVIEKENYLLYVTTPKQDSLDEKYDGCYVKKDKEEILKHFDVEKGITNCGGQREDYEQILEVVLRHGQTRIDRLQKMIQEEDYENYTIDVHALKSTAANVGAMELSKTAYEHEMAGKEKRYEYQRENYISLINQYAQILREIAEALQKEVNIPVIEEPKEAIQDEEVRKLLESIKHFMDEFEMDQAENLLAEMQHLSLKAEIADRVKAIYQMIQNLDMAAASETMEKLLQDINPS